MSRSNGIGILPETPDFTPLRVLEVEIRGPLPAVSSTDSESGQTYRRAFSLVRLHQQPLGVVELDLDEHGLTPAACADRIWQNLASEINRHLRDDGLPEIRNLGPDGIPHTNPPGCVRERDALLSEAPFVSVVVATRDRLDSLKRCVESLLAMEYPGFEIVIVDNAPSSNATADMVRHRYGDVEQVRLVTEPTPGLANAHNRGLLEVESPIVAFTDDDVEVDALWLTQFVRGFNAAGNTGCVTGMILPAELQTPTQLFIERHTNFNKGFEQRIFDLQDNRPDDPLFPYTAGTFGSGANMAFKTSVLHDMGGFDPALGAGSDGFGGDDLAAFYDVITGGHALVYEPSAMIWHRHHREYSALRKLKYDYGVGLAAYLTKTVMDRPGSLFNFAGKIPRGLRHALNLGKQGDSRNSTDYPRELTGIERRGMLYGPFAYLRGRWRHRKTRRQFALHGKPR